ncbi:sodium/proline symporter PutP [Streptomyces sp. Je 1-4]|uniref:sodium/proline symporter PutP n=1 Tax=Streptomyces TaxID=1883 RepID=UPI002180CA78|nr:MULTISPECIES: sodium/proline symporter PutP [unclassified Streptomyces]UYB38539.1 sodium/proline symporter PutP [Streptomyces sp. Je 1-4]UZQ34502.1 sodium/proline symporter PutP [Streptomyces sp. Je 1-4] [Streptomyces sp. Je 1-4 4N24]UZQ41920.1 sodium/proline symporter PutP [Streptomyces sp. Je 1-4] [Streptomyces sp. Je 1-4 4N24_ara]
MITFGIFLLAMVAVGIWTYQDTVTFSDFALGGRRLRAPLAALSAGASDMSGWLFLGLPGAVYTAGIGASWIAVGLAIGTYLNWLLVAPRLRTYTELAGDAKTLSAYLEERFEDGSRMLRLVSATVTVVFFTVYVASGLLAGGVLFEGIFGGGFEFALTVFAVVIVVYTVLGGFRAVSVTHSIQATVMFCAAVALPVIAIATLGGFGALHGALTRESPALLDMGAEAGFDGSRWTSGGPLGAVAVISLLAWGLGYFGQPHILARFMSIRSTREIPRARRIGVSWVVVCLAGASLVGLVGIAALDQTPDNPETVFIALCAQLVNPWVAGILLVGVLAAIKSTADSQLLVSAMALTEDFYRAFVKRQASDATMVLAARATVVVVALVAYVIALSGGAVLDIVAYAWAGFGAAFGPVILLSLYWPRMTRAGAMAGIVTGAATVVLWKHIDPLLGPLQSGIYEMVPGVLAATAAALLFGKFVGRPPRRTWVGPMERKPATTVPVG